jgi:hypothetical protein
MSFHFNASLSAVRPCRFSACLKRRSHSGGLGGIDMHENSNGKLMVCASSSSFREEHLKPVSLAIEKMARLLKMDVELVTFREEVRQIYVYYKHGDEEPIPIYSDDGKKADAHEIYIAIKSMMFVLSFHPKHSALRHMRREIMQFS